MVTMPGVGRRTADDPQPRHTTTAAVREARRQRAESLPRVAGHPADRCSRAEGIGACRWNPWPARAGSDWRHPNEIYVTGVR